MKSDIEKLDLDMMAKFCASPYSRGGGNPLCQVFINDGRAYACNGFMAIRTKAEGMTNSDESWKYPWKGLDEQFAERSSPLVTHEFPGGFVSAIQDRAVFDAFYKARGEFREKARREVADLVTDECPNCGCALHMDRSTGRVLSDNEYEKMVRARDGADDVNFVFAVRFVCGGKRFTVNLRHLYLAYGAVGPFGMWRFTADDEGSPAIYGRARDSDTEVLVMGMREVSEAYEIDLDKRQEEK